MKPLRIIWNTALLLCLVFAPFARLAAAEKKAGKLERIRISADGKDFVRGKTAERFLVWGVNYDHDRDSRLLEDYWTTEWPTVVEDFQEIKALGANTVRIHLQLAKFMRTPTEPDKAALKQLDKLLKLAEDTGLYLDLTGLGCYHLKDVPTWYDSLSESERWNVQARFWEAIAKTCAKSNAVFCYDLMNEPIMAGGKRDEKHPWLAGELGGNYFVQRLTLDAAGRDDKEIAKAWVNQLSAAIRKVDKGHLITVGVIPWVQSFPTAKPLFYSPEASANLDFVSVHFYPKKNELAQTIKALKAYDIGKPLVIEETFPLSCGFDEMTDFIHQSRPVADGWISFYWGKRADEYAQSKDFIDQMMKEWLTRYQSLGREILGQ